MGIPVVQAPLTPEAKVAWVQQQQEKGEVVLMLGDGLNDAAALSQADIGVGVRGSLEAVLEAGSVAIARDDPHALGSLKETAKTTRRVILEACLWAFAYNVVAVTAVWLGIWGPLVCAIAMPVSSLLVVLWVLHRLKER